MAFLVVGDIHGDGESLPAIWSAAENHGCHTIIQLGDLGFFPGRTDFFLEELQEIISAHEIEFLWIDGNHENHDELDRRVHPVTKHHVRRGDFKVIDGQICGFLGGAYSVDRRFRIKHQTWFPQEVVTAGDVECFPDCEILFAHDAPLSAPPHYGDFVNEDQSRKWIDVAAKGACHVFHGHHHKQSETSPEYGVRDFWCYGLADCRSFECAAFVVDDKKTGWVNLWE